MKAHKMLACTSGGPVFNRSCLLTLRKSLEADHVAVEGPLALQQSPMLLQPVCGVFH